MKINPDHESNHDTVCQNMRYIYKLFEKDDNVEGMRLANKVFGHAKSMDEKLKYYKNTYEPNVPSNHSRKMREGLIFRDGFWVYPYDFNAAKREINIFDNLLRMFHELENEKIHLLDAGIGALADLLSKKNTVYLKEVVKEKDILFNNIENKSIKLSEVFNSDDLIILINSASSLKEIKNAMTSGAGFVIDLSTLERFSLVDFLNSDVFSEFRIERHVVSDRFKITDIYFYVYRDQSDN